MKKFIIIVMGLLCVGCGDSDRPPKPDNLIPKDQMSDILYDVFLLNAAKGINKNILEANGVFPQDYLFKKYKIDSLQFAMSNTYYSYDIDTYEKIINKVKERITLEKKFTDSIIKMDEKKRDSVRIRKKWIKDTLKIHKSLEVSFDTIPRDQRNTKTKVFGQEED